MTYTVPATLTANNYFLVFTDNTRDQPKSQLFVIQVQAANSSTSATPYSTAAASASSSSAAAASQTSPASTGDAGTSTGDAETSSALPLTLPSALPANATTP